MSDREPERFEQELELQRLGMPSSRVSVAIDERGLVLDEKIACARDQFMGGAFENLTTHFRVLIVAKSDDAKSQGFWSFVVSDHETAQAMLRAAGLDADHHALEVRPLRSTLSAAEVVFPAVIVSGVFFGFLVYSTAIGICMLIAAMGVLFAANAARPMHTRIALLVGSDGVRRTHFRRTDFFPFTRARDVWSSKDLILMQLVGGPPVVLKAVTVRRELYPRISFDEAVGDLLKMRIREGIHRAALATEVLRQDFEIARGARELRSWLTELRARRAGAGDYRTAPSPDIDLDALFADGSLDAQTRAGAAIALRARDGEAAAPRLRVAAATTASPALRVAFEKIADGQLDDELEDRLAKLR
ncbi:MAG: hypothetical protein ABI183_00125 [Polyangiaceae bacterium]